jgi:hypothetical protein
VWPNGLRELPALHVLAHCRGKVTRANFLSVVVSS